MNKLNTTIILSLILMLSGCAANTDEAPSATTAATTTTVATTTTAAATTQATTTSAQTTAVSEQSEPAETTAVTTTTTATTTEPVIVVEDEKPEPEKPAESTTPDGKYDLADTDLQNPDGTYTQDCSSVDSITVPGFLADKNPEIFIGSGRKSNPSKIPYSEITLENAAEAFPYLGFIGYVPDYLEILPTDTEAQIRLKVMHNLYGEAPKLYSGHSMDQYPGHYFSSEAEYNAYVADQEAQRAAADAAAAAAQERIDSGDYGFSGTKEDIENILAGW